MVRLKCLPVLYLLITLPTSTPIAAAPASRPARTRATSGASSSSVAASRSSRLRAPVGGQHRVAAGDQPLAGEIIRGDLGEILLTGQGQLQRPVAGDQLADGRGAPRGDPPVGVRPGRPVFQLVQGSDPGAGDHAAVAGHNHPGQPEFLPHHRGDLGEGGRVAGAAGPPLCIAMRAHARYVRPAGGVAQASRARLQDAPALTKQPSPRRTRPASPTARHEVRGVRPREVLPSSHQRSVDCSTRSSCAISASEN